MEVVILQVFVSLLLVVGSVLLFAFTCRQRDFEHADRLALLPLDDEMNTAHGPGATTPERHTEKREPRS
jgi:hypothetical protein